MPDKIAESALSKVRWRLIPFLFLLYIIAYLDRVNVGLAAIDMNRDLGFSAVVYGIGSGIFFFSYAVLEVPSNLMLARVGARRLIARIMLTWGALSTAMIFVRSEASFYLIRFLLGAAEAGFFPGVIFYLTQWFPARDRAQAIALTLSIAAFGIWGALGPFWTLPPAFLRGRAAAGGIALVNSVGAIGGFAGPILIGWIRDTTRGFSADLLSLAALLIAGAAIAIIVPVEKRVPTPSSI